MRSLIKIIAALAVSAALLFSVCSAAALTAEMSADRVELFNPSLAEYMASSADTEAVKNTVYGFLTENLSLTPAAAAGIMGNIMVESSFRSWLDVMDTNGKLSYGLVMWNGGRRTALFNWCDSHGYSHDDPEGQLGYLKYELENTEKEAYEAMKAIPNTLEGAVEATVKWADLFERCTKRGYYYRIYCTVNTFWPQYAGGGASKNPGTALYYYNVPNVIRQGKPLSVIGTAVSYSEPLKSLTVGVYDKNGNDRTSITVRPTELAVMFAGEIDDNILYNKLPVGQYYYRVTAETSNGYVMYVNELFEVKDSGENDDRIVYVSEAGFICEHGVRCPTAKFDDAPPSTSWAHKGLDYVISEGIFKGTSENEISPNGVMTRAMLITALWRMAGEPETPEIVLKTPAETENDDDGQQNDETDPELTVEESPEPTAESDTEVPTETEIVTDGTKELPFEDINPEGYYIEALKWAYKNEIVNGVTETEFCPGMTLTREQTVTLFFRLCQWYGLDTKTDATLDGFTDRETVKEYARDAFVWAVGYGIVDGMPEEDGTQKLCPQEGATRAQIAALLMRYCEKYGA